ncbi:MAG: L,D-transpeptidase family protein [Flavobacterium sp.]|nr:L,D-transpeptidase family protein [Pedobacter sp.]
MNKILSVTIFAILIFSSCHGQRVKIVEVQSDKTITPATSFSKLFIDSAKLEVFIKEHEPEDSNAAQLRNFYKRRNYQFAWFTEDGIAEHTRSFWNLHNNYISDFGDTDLKFKNFHRHIDLLMNDDMLINIATERVLQTELELTMHFFEYSNNAYSGKLNPDELQWHIPRKKINAGILLDSLIARSGKNLQDWEPVNIYYQRLKKELVHYHAIDKAGGWQEIALDKLKKYKPGDTALVIKQVKQRLLISGNDKTNDTTEYYTSGLIAAIKRTQKSFGIKEDGVITAALIKELNVSVEERIKTLMINLERMRWVPQQPQGDLIIVNIPEFKLHVFESAKKLFSINIVVGKAANNTVIFTGQLNHVVFSPYWNVPRSIVRNEILPAIKRNRNYLAKMNMEQTGFNEGLPMIRQKPGGANSLGKVKFIFPNNYSIYFHDTPAKSLFNEDSRAFSHGCIRLAEPVKLATYLLRDQPEWTKQKMNRAMTSSVEKWVLLKPPLPVFITYFTAWVDSEGLLNFRKDIYSHDQKLAKHLFVQEDSN